MKNVSICIFNFKGGVGKTTATMNIGCALGEKGFKVCLIDLDPQANLTIGLGLKDQINSAYEFMLGKLDFKEVVKKIRENVFVIPSHLRLSKIDYELRSDHQKDLMLKERIDPYKKEFDFIIIDTPTTLNNLTSNAFLISDILITPIEAEFYSLQGFYTVNESLQKMGKKVDAIFVNKYDKRKVLNRDIFSFLQEYFKGKIFHTKIRNNISLAESQSQFTDIFSYNKKSHGSEDFLALTQEILEYIKEKDNAC